jgi:hypothetical protein
MIENLRSRAVKLIEQGSDAIELSALEIANLRKDGDALRDFRSGKGGEKFMGLRVVRSERSGNGGGNAR